MVIVKDLSIVKKWLKKPRLFFHKRKIDKINEVVVHHTAGGGGITTLRSWMLEGERKKQYKRGIALFHFAIDRKGSIYQFGNLNTWFYHSSSRKHDKKTIGIELLHREGLFTDGQYKSLCWLIFDHLKLVCPNLERIVSHDYNYNTYSGGRKGCPGKRFEWKRLETYMIHNCISFNDSGFECYKFFRRP